ncbi:WD40 repeat domain-containing protein [Nonomuraea sp. bgisy101]|uniref:WD40 repeat domain-containing protein n=1 Tax=Nonomuraea sp. bgisy101 TaxID=3413784 RepID=UPI003D70D58C
MSAAEPLARIAVDDCRCVSLSADGSALFTVAQGRAEVREHEGPPVWSAPVHAPGELPVEAAWTPDSDQVFLVCGARLLAFAADSGEPFALPAEVAERADVTALALSGDGMTAAIGTREGTILLLDRGTSAVVRWPGRSDPVRALAFDPSGAELCVARSRAIQFWRRADRTMVASVGVGDLFPSRLAWSREGALVAVVGTRDVRTVDVRTRKEAATPWRPEGGPVTLGFSRDGTRILVGTGQGAVHLLDRQLAEDEPPAPAVPAQLTEPATMHLGAYGLLAARTDASTVTLWRLADTRLPTDAQRADGSLLRWAAKNARTVGRSPRTTARTAARMTVLAPRDAARPDPGFCWTPDGSGWYAETSPGVLTRSGAPLAGALPHAPAHEIDTAGPLVAVGGTNPDRVTVLDAGSGEQVADLAGGTPAWSPAAPRTLAVARPSLLHVHRDLDARPLTIPVRVGTGRPAWSPDGRLLAAPAGEEVGVWSLEGTTPLGLVRLADPAFGGLRVGPLAWSPDGRYLAATTTGGRAPVTVWSTEDWRRRWRLGRSDGAGRGPCLTWSPDSRVLAFPSPATPGAVELWEPGAGLAHTLQPPDPSVRHAWAVRWSPDGHRLAVTYDAGQIVLWDLPGEVLPRREQGRLPYEAETMARLGAAAAAAGAQVPLSTLADLLTLVVSRAPEALEAVDAHRAVVALRALHWPVAAALGLAVLLAADLPPDPGHAAPAAVPPERLEAALTRALTGVPVPAARAAVPMTELVEALNRVDDGVLTLLTLLSPEAVAAEPELPVRLRRQGMTLWPLSERQRRLLGVRASVWNEGATQGRGLGEARAGVTRHGEPSALLPSQFALPPQVLTARHVRDELLYRTRQGAVPAVSESMIVVLDDTPAAHGAVGATLRVVAHLLCANVLARHRRCALILLAAPARTRLLSTMNDLVHLWGEASLTPPAVGEAARMVRSAAAQLGQGAAEPRTVVLTHPHLAFPGGREVTMVRAHYPGHPVEQRAPRTFSLSPGAGPDEVYEVIAGILAGQPQSI